MGIHFCQKIRGDFVPFETDNEKIVVAAKVVAELPVKFGLGMVFGKELLEVVVEFQGSGHPSHPGGDPDKGRQSSPRQTPPRGGDLV